MTKATRLCVGSRDGWKISLLLAILTLAGAGSAVWAQSEGEPPKTKHIPQTVQRVRLSINHSVALEFSTPIKKVVMADDKIAAAKIMSPKLVMITGRIFGFTQLVIWDKDNRQFLYDIRVDIDLSQLEQTLRDAAPRAEIKAYSILDNVVISGTVPDAPTADRLIELAKVFAAKVLNQLHVAGTHQILLRATIAEVVREAVRQLGLNGTFFGAKAFGGSNLDLINPTTIGLAKDTLIPIGLPNSFQIGSPGLGVAPTTTLYFGLPSSQLELFLLAMERDSLIRILAEPTQVTLSGHEASFVAGGELPIPTPTDDGLAITFREYGIKLRFLPVVQAGQIIRLDMTTEVSEPDFTNAVQIAGMTIPGFTKRRTHAVVEVGAGQTFAIAGLLSESMRGISTRIPGAGSLPVLGALFRSVNYQRSQTELIVLITADFAAPMNPEQVTYIPGADLQTPTDWQLYGLGMLYDDTIERSVSTTQPAQASVLPPGPLRGPWGPEQAQADSDE